MAKFWRLRKCDYYFAAIELKNRIPELSKADTDQITSRLRGTNFELFYKESVPAPIWIRITLPFGLITMLVFFILLPVNFLITGRWGYRFTWLTNWFKALGF